MPWSDQALVAELVALLAAPSGNDDGDDDDDDDDDDAKGDHLVVAVDVLLPQVSILLLQLFQLVSHPVLIRMTVMMAMLVIY